MSESLVHPFGEPWSIEDLAGLPDDGMRYELVDGSLLVSPHAGVPHGRIVQRLRRKLEETVPERLEIGQDLAVRARTPRSYFVPDLWIVRAEALERDSQTFEPDDLVLVVEVLSEGNRGVDLVLKRHFYADGGIPEYWIVDPPARTITVLRLEEGQTQYTDVAVVKAGETYRADVPFPLALDPADVL
jgi:Uma2 family endonuclease